MDGRDEIRCVGAWMTDGYVDVWMYAWMGGDG